MSEKAASVSREVSLRRRKTTSSYHYRRRSKALFVHQCTAELKHVLGLTSKNNSSFSCDPYSGLLAYPAGCVIVLYNPRQETQTHIINPGHKTLTCLKFSNDGCFIVTGEAGHRPCVRVFSVTDRSQVVSFSSHKFGISCVAFSPNGKYITSIGFQHDNVINVWDWKKNKLAASNKVSTKIKAVAFAEDGSHFITVGNRHVKYWYLEEPSADQITVPLKGRSAILETLRNHVFCDVICGCAADPQYAFTITRSGILCQLNSGRTVEKSVDLKCGSTRSICSIDGMILCSCSCGSVHVFDANSLEFLTEILPLDQLRGTEIIAISIDVRNMWMHCVFGDHSFVVYNVLDLTSPQVHTLNQFHGSCVWDIKILPYTSECESLPRDSFLTCSNDGSARAWQYDGKNCRLLKIIKLHKGIEDVDSEGATKHEARCLCIRSDGKHLAIGDRTGNVHVYNQDTFEKLAYIPTHEGDVLCMDYSQNGDMLASASRDRCVHTFDSRYNPTHTIADHSAAVTAVKFAQHENDFRLITCGSDKSLYFCSIRSNNGKSEITREQHFVEKHSMSDMAVLDDTVLLACGCNLSEYDVIGGKLRRTFRGNEGSVAILRVAVNYHRTLVATSCADKQIYILDFSTGDCMCVLSGHSEVAVALTFDTENRLLSASADGCVFIWKLIRRVPDDFRNLQQYNGNSNVTTPDSPDLDKTAYFAGVRPSKLSINEKATPRTMTGESFSALFFDSDQSEEAKTDAFQATPVNSIPDATSPFDLPTWVTKAIMNENDNLAYPTPRPALGKWGQRLEADKICEELGNLPLSVDISSIRSSMDNDDGGTSVNDNESIPASDADSTSDPADVEKLPTQELPESEESNDVEKLPTQELPESEESNGVRKLPTQELPESEESNDVGKLPTQELPESEESNDVGKLPTQELPESEESNDVEKLPTQELPESEESDNTLLNDACSEGNIDAIECVKQEGHDSASKIAPEKDVSADIALKTTTLDVKNHEVVTVESSSTVKSDVEGATENKNTENYATSSSPPENLMSLQDEFLNLAEDFNSAHHDIIDKDQHHPQDLAPIPPPVYLPPMLENDVSTISNHNSQCSPVDEDIDMRKIHFTNKQSQLKSDILPKSNRLFMYENEHELHSTPKSHFTASVSIKLNPPKPNISSNLKQPASDDETTQYSNALTDLNVVTSDYVTLGENNGDDTSQSKVLIDLNVNALDPVTSEQTNDDDTTHFNTDSAPNTAISDALDPITSEQTNGDETTHPDTDLAPNTAISDALDPITSRQTNGDETTHPDTNLAPNAAISDALNSRKNDADELTQYSTNISTAVDDASRDLVDQVQYESTVEETNPTISGIFSTKDLANDDMKSDSSTDDYMSDNKTVCENQNNDHTRDKSSTSKCTQFAPRNSQWENNKLENSDMTTYSCTSQEFDNGVKNPRLKSRSLDFKPGRSSAMPPAFAEFIANLTKKKTISPRPNPTISHSSNSQLHQNGTNTDSRTKLQQMVHAAGRRVVENVESKEIEADRHPRRDSRKSSTIIQPEMSSNHLPSQDDVDECQKVSDDLMNLFNHAVALYRKQKVLHDTDESLTNGSLDGFNKLLRTFQIMHSRLNRLKFLSNSIDSYPTPDPRHLSVNSRSMSLDNLASDSPVVSLLREYSDKLLGLVHTQVYETPSDTV